MGVATPSILLKLSKMLLQSIGPAIFLAGALWAVKHTADRFGDSPTIEFSITTVAKPELGADAQEIRASLRNLSLKGTVRDAKFLFVTRTTEQGVLSDTRFELDERLSQAYFYPPAVTVPAVIRADHPGVTFEIPTIPPGGRIDLMTVYRGSDAPRFVGSSEKERESFALVERGFRTQLVAREMEILYGGLVLWFVLLVCAGTLVWRKSNLDQASSSLVASTTNTSETGATSGSS